MHLSRGLILVVGSVAAFVSAQAFARVSPPESGMRSDEQHLSRVSGDPDTRLASDSSTGPYVLEESSLQVREAAITASAMPPAQPVDSEASNPDAVATVPLPQSFAAAAQPITPAQSPSPLPIATSPEVASPLAQATSVGKAPEDPWDATFASSGTAGPSKKEEAGAASKAALDDAGAAPIAGQAADAVYSAQSSGNPSQPPQDVIVVQSSSQCGSSLQSVINAAASGSTLNLLGCSYTSPAINISKPLTIIGPKVTFPTNNRWGDGVAISSDGVTLDRWTITGGGNVVSIFGRSNVRIANSSFGGQIGSAFSIWGEGRGSNNVVIEGNRVNPGNTYQVSPIMGRASEDCSVHSLNLIIRNNFMDQGTGSAGWFGIELKCHDGVTIEGNTLKNGQVLVSLPDTDNVMIKGNVFDLRGSPFWGVEVAKAMNVTVQGNTFIGDGQNGGDHAVSMNSGAMYTVVKNNTARDIRTLLDTTGDYITLTDNCITQVLRVTEYEHSAPFVQRVVSNNVSC
jgi:hypothetical protein